MSEIGEFNIFLLTMFLIGVFLFGFIAYNYNQASNHLIDAKIACLKLNGQLEFLDYDEKIIYCKNATSIEIFKTKVV